MIRLQVPKLTLLDIGPQLVRLFQDRGQPRIDICGCLLSTYRIKLSLLNHRLVLFANLLIKRRLQVLSFTVKVLLLLFKLPLVTLSFRDVQCPHPILFNLDLLLYFFLSQNFLSCLLLSLRPFLLLAAPLFPLLFLMPHGVLSLGDLRVQLR